MELDRLASISLALTKTISGLNAEQRRALTCFACNYAVKASKTDDPLVVETLNQLLADEACSESRKQELKQLIEKLDDEYFQLQDDQPDNDALYMPLFYQARAVSALLQAFSADSYEAAVESIYEASMTSPDQERLIHELRSLIESKTFSKA